MSEEPQPLLFLTEADLTQYEYGLRKVNRRFWLLLVFVVVLVTILASFTASLKQQKCGQRYATAQYNSQVPLEKAQKALNAADAAIWESTQKILTQSATQVDYATLRQEVRARNTLWEQLAAEQEANPIPPPPGQFC